MSNNSVIYTPEAFEKMKGMVQGCYAKVYLDETLMNPEIPTMPFDVNSIAPAGVEAAVFYSGPSSTPIKYAKLNSRCGVLVIHSRR